MSWGGFEGVHSPHTRARARAHARTHARTHAHTHTLSLSFSYVREGGVGGRVCEANRSKQLGQRKKTIFPPVVLVFTRGMTKAWVSDVNSNCVFGM